MNRAGPTPDVGQGSNAEETIARGRSGATPFVLLGGVAVLVWSTVALVSALALVIWWLA